MNLSEKVRSSNLFLFYGNKEKENFFYYSNLITSNNSASRDIYLLLIVRQRISTCYRKLSTCSPPSSPISKWRNSTATSYTSTTDLCVFRREFILCRTEFIESNDRRTSEETGANFESTVDVSTDESAIFAE
uniref:Uncharacterized protein n=1 Tax=Caenorhabditis tropicalis TaxID=1561998 RepID=A0A1I7UW91_9PELO